ncbi:MAG: 4Fe-4S binding protein [Vicinamibacterales bacterium]|nr:ferredoxin [Acidobacteriota bacterium]MDP6373461.1 4Fe-4S binding protein [Vicinamibacterales bacterium]MDP6607575.1 4Fe-4S binding protein [Vicinamibacterales bacterium]
MKWTAGKITYAYDEEQCTCGAALCVEACAQSVLDANEETDKMEIVNTVQCIFCKLCEEICPTKAISIQGALTLDDVVHERDW